MNCKQWNARVARPFVFLRREFGCAIVDCRDVWWATTVTYQNATTAVEVTYSVEFQRVEVQLVRLVDGRRPPYPVFVSEAPRLHHFLLDAVLSLRAPAALAPIEPHFGVAERDVRAALRLWAEALRQHASDVLRGDFSVFDTLEEQVRAQVADHPERIVVWAPEDRPEGGRAAADIAAQHPGIEVEHRAYVRHSRRT